MKINEKQLRAIIREAIEDTIGLQGEGNGATSAEEVAEMFNLDGGVTTVTTNGREEVRLFGSSANVEYLFRDKELRDELHNYMDVTYFVIGDSSNMANKSFVQGVLK